MFVEDRFVFYHVPKTGGTWLRKRLHREYDCVPHDYWHLGQSRLPREHWYKPAFSVIRNPWDWHVSWFHFWHKQRDAVIGKDRHGGLRNRMIDRTLTYRTFEQYVMAESMIDYCDWMLPRDTHLFRLEDGLEAFLNHLRDQFPPTKDHKTFGWKHENVGERPPDYRECYSAKTKDWVAKQEKILIERFSYEF